MPQFITSNFMLFIQKRLSLLSVVIIAIAITWINFNASYWRNHQGVVKHDVISYYSYLPAAVIYKDLSFKFIDNDWNFFHDKIWVLTAPDGGRFQKMTMGLSFMYAPFFLAGHALALITGAEATGYSWPYMFLLQFSSLFYLLIGLVFLRRVLLRYFAEHITAIVLLVMVLGTNLLYYVTKEAAMPHSYNFCLFAVFIWLTIRWYETQKWVHSIALGLVFGLISLIRPSNALIAVFFILYDVKSFREFILRTGFFLKHWKQILAIACCAFFVFVPQFIFWKQNLGTWLWYSYGDEGFFFSRPQIINGLFSFRKGWLLYTPVMIFALLGLFSLLKNNRQFFIPLITFTILNIYVIFSWWCWWYGGSFSSRPMIDSYPLMAISLGSFLVFIASFRRLQPIIYALIFLMTMLSVFQTQQYKRGSLHFDSMSRQAYFVTFGKLFITSEFIDALDPPDYNAAKKGIQAISLHSKQTIPKSMHCDFELLTPDSLYFYSTDKRFLISRVQFRTNEMARSGEYSVRLTPEHQYGADFRMRARPQDVYVLSVWRYPAVSEGRLVFSAEKENDFYRAFRTVTEKDENGWGKIEAEITIPHGIAQPFKIYLWNPGSEPVYFDDITITKQKK